MKKMYVGFFILVISLTSFLSIFCSAVRAREIHEPRIFNSAVGSIDIDLFEGQLAKIFSAPSSSAVHIHAIRRPLNPVAYISGGHNYVLDFRIIGGNPRGVDIEATCDLTLNEDTLEAELMKCWNITDHVGMDGAKFNYFTVIQ